MTSRFALVALATLALLNLARAAADDAIKKETKKLQGTWQLVSLDFGGTADPPAMENRMVIEGNKFILLTGDTVEGEGTFKIIEVKGKSRKTDITWTKGDKYITPFCRNIAEWTDDDTFRTCTGHEGQRPTKFTGDGGSAVLVFKRMKKK